ncbi:MAG: hypothetical protein JW772_01600 [Candidatus Diapherotrites archaeon]|nr:hypothetical protein [Candidatus Diapherotrites archaeon]
MFLNRRGQSFDVFKLLISAIVAVAILAILLAIIQPWNPQGDPIRETKKLVGEIAGSPSTPATSQEVIFKKGITINSGLISSASQGLVAEHAVCIVPGDFSGQDSIWESYNGVRVTYKGTSDTAAVIHAICDVCSKISESGYFTTYDPNMEEEWLDECNDSVFSTENSDETCCLFAIKRSI